jgi:uncharacterized membrane protein YgcG
MKYLNQLLPAEALLVFEGNNCNLRRYLKAGFMHLVLKQVLKVQANNGVPTQNGLPDKLVVAGKNLLTYNAADCEQPLLALFDTSASQYGQEGFWFSQLVKVAYQKAGSKSSYVNRVHRYSNNPGWYKQGFWQRAFGGVSLSKGGLEVQQDINKEVNDLEAALPGYIANDPAKAQDILRQIKGNVFLLRNVDLAALNAIDKDLLAAMNKKETETDGSSTAYVSSCSSGCSGCGTWDSYSDYSGSWDSSCSSDSGSGSGGDSGGGDSGCSGCGGCGGGGD